MIKLATVFSGIGSVEHALEKLNIDNKIIFACDNGDRKIKVNISEVLDQISNMNNEQRNEYIKNHCYGDKKNLVEETYKANYRIDNKCFYQDVRFLDGNEYRGEIDLFVGGSPCQSFSIMGKRKGLDEARGTLFYDYARLISEICPKVFIYENVTGMLNHDKGKTWQVISNIFDELNYCWVYWVLNAKDFGIPQNRRRIFVIGFRNDLKKYFDILEVPKKRELIANMDSFLETNVPNKFYLPEKGFNRVIDPKQKKHVALNGTVARCQVACQQYNWFGDMRFEKEIPERLESDERIFKGYYNGVRGVTRCLTPRECLRLMGFDDKFKIVVNDQQMYKQVGNSIAVNVLMEVLNTIVRTGVFYDNG